jgi:hypothetical protein
MELRQLVVDSRSLQNTYEQQRIDEQAILTPENAPY